MFNTFPASSFAFYSSNGVGAAAFVCWNEIKKFHQQNSRHSPIWSKMVNEVMFISRKCPHKKTDKYLLVI